MILLAATLSLTECLVMGGIGLFFLLEPRAQSESARKKVLKMEGFTRIDNNSRAEMETVCKFVKDLDEYQFINPTEDEWLHKSTYKLLLNGKHSQLACLFRAAHIAGVNLSVRMKSSRDADEKANESECISSFVTHISSNEIKREQEKKEENEMNEKKRNYGYYKQ